MITPEQHAEIRRLYYGEHWTVGTIAAALGVHHDTVRATIAHDPLGVRRGTCRATQLDPYLPVIRDTLAQYPRLRATRLTHCSGSWHLVLSGKPDERRTPIASFTRSPIP